MLFLAEISDKMPSIPQMWLIAMVRALPFVAIAAIHRWAACVSLLLALVFFGRLTYDAYHEAYLDAGLREAVWSELGGVWVFHSLAAFIMPVILVTAITFLKWRHIFTIPKRPVAQDHH